MCRKTFYRDPFPSYLKWNLNHPKRILRMEAIQPNGSCNKTKHKEAVQIYNLPINCWEKNVLHPQVFASIIIRTIMMGPLQTPNEFCLRGVYLCKGLMTLLHSSKHVGQTISEWMSSMSGLSIYLLKFSKRTHLLILKKTLKSEMRLPYYLFDKFQISPITIIILFTNYYFWIFLIRAGPIPKNSDSSYGFKPFC